MGRITKAGDPYLRSLLVLGARAVLALVIRQDNPRQDPLSRWARALAERRGYWRAVVPSRPRTQESGSAAKEVKQQ